MIVFPLCRCFFYIVDYVVPVCEEKVIQGCSLPISVPGGHQLVLYEVGIPGFTDSLRPVHFQEVEVPHVDEECRCGVRRYGYCLV